jgi:hypothetical protein
MTPIVDVMIKDGQATLEWHVNPIPTMIKLNQDPETNVSNYNDNSIHNLIAH